MKLLIFLSILIACLAFSSAAPCMEGHQLCEHHHLTAFEHGMIYCCSADYDSISTSIHHQDGVQELIQNQITFYKNVSCPNNLVKMKLFFFISFLIACLAFSAAAPCMEGHHNCQNAHLTSFEQGQLYCCSADYDSISTSIHHQDGFQEVRCQCH
nr:hypothetical protein BgiMline_010543 [Biomphalaria glabrata]